MSITHPSHGQGRIFNVCSSPPHTPLPPLWTNVIYPSGVLFCGIDPRAPHNKRQVLNFWQGLGEDSTVVVAGSTYVVGGGIKGLLHLYDCRKIGGGVQFGSVP